jgi:hypothetical protein
MDFGALMSVILTGARERRTCSLCLDIVFLSIVTMSEFCTFSKLTFHVYSLHLENDEYSSAYTFSWLILRDNLTIPFMLIWFFRIHNSNINETLDQENSHCLKMFYFKSRDGICQVIDKLKLIYLKRSTKA